MEGVILNEAPMERRFMLFFMGDIVMSSAGKISE